MSHMHNINLDKDDSYLVHSHQLTDKDDEIWRLERHIEYLRRNNK